MSPSITTILALPSSATALKPMCSCPITKTACPTWGAFPASCRGIVTWCFRGVGSALSISRKNSQHGRDTQRRGRRRPDHHPRCPPCVVVINMRFGLLVASERGTEEAGTMGSSAEFRLKSGTATLWAYSVRYGQTCFREASISEFEATQRSADAY